MPASGEHLKRYHGRDRRCHDCQKAWRSETDRAVRRALHEHPSECSLSEMQSRKGVKWYPCLTQESYEEWKLKKDGMQREEEYNFLLNAEKDEEPEWIRASCETTASSQRRVANRASSRQRLPSTSQSPAVRQSPTNYQPSPIDGSSAVHQPLADHQPSANRGQPWPADQSPGSTLRMLPGANNDVVKVGNYNGSHISQVCRISTETSELHQTFVDSHPPPGIQQTSTSRKRPLSPSSPISSGRLRPSSGNGTTQATTLVPMDSSTSAGEGSRPQDTGGSEGADIRSAPSIPGDPGGSYLPLSAGNPPPRVASQGAGIANNNTGVHGSSGLGQIQQRSSLSFDYLTTKYQWDAPASNSDFGDQPTFEQEDGSALPPLTHGTRSNPDTESAIAENQDHETGLQPAYEKQVPLFFDTPANNTPEDYPLEITDLIFEETGEFLDKWNPGG
ncbi:hypothetical protein VTJ83DRAFT_1041 [Remersonia thermophila]|uniref:C2H2-type domain-containing protein n=1 Tax=Remersonia thermophila TaxID=72144 RepID=A0ABR4DMV9_9PEZI